MAASPRTWKLSSKKRGGAEAFGSEDFVGAQEN